MQSIVRAVGSLVVRASDSRPEGLGSVPDATKHPPSAHGFTCRNCGGGVRGCVAIYRLFGELRRAKIVLSPVWCSRLTTGVPLAHATMNFVGLDLTTSDSSNDFFYSLNSKVRYGIGDLTTEMMSFKKWNNGFRPSLVDSQMTIFVPRLHLVDYGSIRSQSSALVSSVLGLRFHVQQHHLRQGELRLRCESTLAREILRRREEVIFEGRHETAELQVAQIANSVSANSMKCDCSISILLILLLLLHPVYRMPEIINAT
ncbi:uncharacterized protein TNCV_24181 [Trichonephila clavipes]|nr:uncharacterized protein TNCV_24181 [Trichonephila clavipes]